MPGVMLGMKALRYLLPILLLPGTVTVGIPALILRRTGWSGWAVDTPLSAVGLLTGLACLIIGLSLAIQTMHLFIRIGRGTPAPWDPPNKLVLAGPYLRVRNPMISGVFFILLGEALCFQSWAIFRWFVLFVIINLTYIPLLEEPSLQERFGEEYREYKRNVPRWIPRLHHWRPDGNSRKAAKPQSPEFP